MQYFVRFSYNIEKNGGSPRLPALPQGGRMAREDVRTRFTRKVLQDSLVDLMKKKSILDISIKEICGNAGVSRSTFYAYYKDQYDLLGQMEEEILVEFDKIIEKHAQSGVIPLPAKELIMMIEPILQYIVSDSNSIQVFLSENGESSFQRKFARYFTGLMRQFKKHPDSILTDEKILNYHLVFIRDGCTAILQEWLKSDMDMNVRDMAKLFAKLVRGVLV
jgi:AcrR family transcriptional regulator